MIKFIAALALVVTLSSCGSLHNDDDQLWLAVQHVERR